MDPIYLCQAVMKMNNVLSSTKTTACKCVFIEN